MRDIKFRIWDKKNKVMMVDWHNFKFIRTIDKDSFLRLGTNGRKWVLCIAKLEDYTPMQYTGFTDGDGKEIYEGDVVDYIDYGWNDDEYNCIGEVVFEDGSWYVTDAITTNELYNYDGGDIRVIGNIYENPELLREVEL